LLNDYLDNEYELGNNDEDTYKRNLKRYNDSIFIEIIFNFFY